MFVAAFLDEGLAGDLDIVSCLSNVDAIEHVKITLPFNRNGESLVQEVKNYISSFRVRSCDGKIINLTEKNNA